jgi:Phage integrase, N-terminal SAM-like domain
MPIHTCIWGRKILKTVTDIAAPDQAPAASPPLRLLDQVRARIRVLHYSIRTEQTYLNWIKRYIRFFDKRHPRAHSAVHVEQFLRHLAVERNAVAATQNQARSVLFFLCHSGQTTFFAG